VPELTNIVLAKVATHIINALLCETIKYMYYDQ